MMMMMMMIRNIKILNDKFLDSTKITFIWVMQRIPFSYIAEVPIHFHVNWFTLVLTAKLHFYNCKLHISFGLVFIMAYFHSVSDTAF